MPLKIVDERTFEIHIYKRQIGQDKIQEWRKVLKHTYIERIDTKKADALLKSGKAKLWKTEL